MDCAQEFVGFCRSGPPRNPGPGQGNELNARMCSIAEGSPSQNEPRSVLDDTRLSCTRSVDYADAGPGQSADRHVLERQSGQALRGYPAM